MYLDPNLPGSAAVAADAVRQFLDCCFRDLGLEKLCIEAPESEAARFSRDLGWSIALECEAILKSQVMFGGRVQDLHMLAIWRDAYLQREKRDWDTPGSDAFEFVVSVLSDVLGRDLVAPTGGLDLEADLGMQSLDFIEVFDHLESVGWDLSTLEPLEGRPLVLEDLVRLAGRQGS